MKKLIFSMVAALFMAACNDSLPYADGEASVLSQPAE